MKKERQTAEQRFMMNLALKIYQANPGWRPWAAAKKAIKVFKENNIPLPYKTENGCMVAFMQSIKTKAEFTNN